MANVWNCSNKLHIPLSNCPRGWLKAGGSLKDDTNDYSFNKAEANQRYKIISLEQSDALPCITRISASWTLRA